jgi:hypothetical protein
MFRQTTSLYTTLYSPTIPIDPNYSLHLGLNHHSFFLSMNYNLFANEQALSNLSNLHTKP